MRHEGPTLETAMAARILSWGLSHLAEPFLFGSLVNRNDIAVAVSLDFLLRSKKIPLSQKHNTHPFRRFQNQARYKKNCPESKRQHRATWTKVAS